jgi:hypothetical protein
MKESKSQKGGLPYFEGPGFSRGSNKFAHNQWSGHSNDGRLVNKGRGPTKGNDGECHNPGTPASTVTKDMPKRPPVSAVPSVPAQGSVRDSINRGHQYRGQGGTSVNGFKDPNRINVSGYDMGDGKMAKGGRPVAAGKTDGINYGPKKQY